MDRFEAWFDGDESSAPTRRRRTLSRDDLSSVGHAPIRLAALVGGLVLMVSLLGGAHRAGLVTTTGQVEAPADGGGSPDTATALPTPTGSAPGQVAVSGLLPISNCKLKAPPGVFSAGFPMSEFQGIPSAGTVRVAIIYVEFPDATHRDTLDATHQRLQSFVSRIYSEMSYGRLNVELVQNSDWIMMDQPSGDYNVLQDQADEFSVNRYAGEAVRKSDADIDFSGIDAVAIFATQLADGIAGDFQMTLNERISTDEGTGVSSVIVTGGEWWREADDPMALAHELGHSFGLQDLYDGANQATFEAGNKFVGYYDFMSYGWGDSAAPTLFGWDRWRLGWIDDSQVICARPSEGTEIVLQALQSGTGPLIVVLPVSPTRAVVIESRRALGADKNLTEVGALVYTVDVSVESTEGPIRVIADSFGEGYDHAPLSTGEFIDALSYTVTSLEVASWGDRIYVTP